VAEAAARLILILDFKLISDVKTIPAHFGFPIKRNLTIGAGAAWKFAEIAAK
jgi:hypothetical protein